MSQGQAHVVDVQRWIDEYQESLRQAGVDVKAVATNPKNADRVKTSQALQLGRNGILAEVIVWTNGKCEVLYGDHPRGVSVEQRSIRSQQGLEALMSELIAKLYS